MSQHQVHSCLIIRDETLCPAASVVAFVEVISLHRLATHTDDIAAADDDDVAAADDDVADADLPASPKFSARRGPASMRMSFCFYYIRPILYT